MPALSASVFWVVPPGGRGRRRSVPRRWQRRGPGCPVAVAFAACVMVHAATGATCLRLAAVAGGSRGGDTATRRRVSLSWPRRLLPVAFTVCVKVRAVTGATGELARRQRSLRPPPAGIARPRSAVVAATCVTVIAEEVAHDAGVIGIRILGCSSWRSWSAQVSATTLATAWPGLPCRRSVRGLCHDLRPGPHA